MSDIIYVTVTESAGPEIAVTVNNLRGATGPAGPIGPSGGPAGPAGPSGPSGPSGPAGPAGADSTVPGPEGPTGPEGPEGSIGPEGLSGSGGLRVPVNYSPDAAGVTADTDNFTLVYDESVVLVTLNGLALKPSEYSRVGTTLTVTPADGFSSVADVVLVFQGTYVDSFTGIIVQPTTPDPIVADDVWIDTADGPGFLNTYLAYDDGVSVEFVQIATPFGGGGDGLTSVNVPGDLNTTGTPDATTTLHGDGVWRVPAGLTSVNVPGDLNTTGTPDATTTLHGDGVWRVPAAGDGGGSGAGSHAIQYVIGSDVTGYTGGGDIRVCNGVNDQVQINAALATRKPVVCIGTFNVASPILDLYGELRGVGLGSSHGFGAQGSVNSRQGGTLFLPVAGFVGYAVVQIEQSNNYIIGGASVGDFSVSGTNLPANADVVGVLFRSFQGSIRNVEVRSMKGTGGHGFVFAGNNTAVHPKWSTYDSNASFLTAKDCGGAGFRAQNDGTDMHMSHLTGLRCLDGFQHVGGSAIQFENCHWYSNDRNNIRLENGAGTRNHFSNCKIQHSKEHAVLFFDGGLTTNAVEVQFANCDFNSNGEQANDTWSNVEVGFNRQANRLQFVGCTFGNSDNATNLPKYCINLNGTGVGAVITGCSFGNTLAGAGVTTAIVRSRASATSTSVITGNYGLADMVGGVKAATNPAQLQEVNTV